MACFDEPRIDTGLTELSKALDKCISSIVTYGKFEIKKVIFNNPATVILWKDGTKTVVKCQPGDYYDREKGLLLAICKRAYGDSGKYNNIIHQHLNYGSVEIKTETEDLSVESMRHDLYGFCRGKWCTKCPLGGPVCRCGRGTHFLSKDGGGYTMSDGEIRGAYQIVFGSKQEGDK